MRRISKNFAASALVYFDLLWKMSDVLLQFFKLNLDPVQGHIHQNWIAY